MNSFTLKLQAPAATLRAAPATPRPRRPQWKPSAPQGAVRSAQARECPRLRIAILAMLGMSLLAPPLRAAFWPALDPHTPLLNWLLLALIAAPTVPLVLASGRTAADFGLTLSGARHAAVEGLACGLAIVLLLAPVVHACSSDGLRLVWRSSLWAYPIHVVLQEFLARGVIQGSLAHVLKDRRGVRSVVLSALLFGLAHAIYGPGAIAVTFLAGLAFGAVYQRHRNLIGVSVLHTILGLAAFTSGVI